MLKGKANKKEVLTLEDDEQTSEADLESEDNLEKDNSQKEASAEKSAGDDKNEDEKKKLEADGNKKEIEKFEAEKRKHRKAMSELEFDLDDIEPKYRMVAETVGIDAYRIMVAFCGGRNLYLPKYENIIEKKRKRYVYKVFLETGADYSKTAVYCGLSLSTVRRYVKECMSYYKNKKKIH